MVEESIRLVESSRTFEVHNREEDEQIMATLWELRGLRSGLRELESMARTLSDGYHWRIGFLPTKIPGTRITYLTGAAQAPGC